MEPVNTSLEDWEQFVSGPNEAQVPYSSFVSSEPVDERSHKSNAEIPIRMASMRLLFSSLGSIDRIHDEELFMTMDDASLLRNSMFVRFVSRLLISLGSKMAIQDEELFLTTEDEAKVGKGT